MTSAHHYDEPPRSCGWRAETPGQKLRATQVELRCRPSWTVEQQWPLLMSAVSASLIGHLPDNTWWYGKATTAAHFGRGSAFCLHCLSRRVGISVFHSCGGCVAWLCAEHDVIMHAYHARAASALVNLIHLDTASELLNHLEEALGGNAAYLALHA